MEEYHLIQSIPGIGKRTSPILISSIGNIEKFNHVNQLLSFWGLNLCYYQSGQYEGQKKISKQGDKKVRHALWLAVQDIYHRGDVAENIFYETWERKTQGRTLTAIQQRKLKVMLMVKMARIIYTVLKSRTPYGVKSQGKEDQAFRMKAA
ncbi:MAG: IS110 family transposase [Deltaproteobacteria bacterium]|nr:IS110 family transposase [Deltaproteobacteria bacterium]